MNAVRLLWRYHVVSLPLTGALLIRVVCICRRLRCHCAGVPGDLSRYTSDPTPLKLALASAVISALLGLWTAEMLAQLSNDLRDAVVTVPTN